MVTATSFRLDPLPNRRASRQQMRYTPLMPGRIPVLLISLPLLVLLPLLFLSACSSGDATIQCTYPSDCADGETCSDGVCTVLLYDSSTPPTDGGPGDADGSPGDLDLGQDQWLWPDTVSDDGATCTPNNNGMVERDELVFQVPGSVTYTMGTGLTMNLEGTMVGGKPHWNLTQNAADDHDEIMSLDPIPQWAASTFPNGDYVSLLNKGMDVWGVYKVTPTALELIGGISGEEDYGDVSYSPPVELLRFPIQVDDSITSNTTGSGSWGLAVIYNLETYTVDVLTEGVVNLPKLSLDALLVRVKVEQTPYANPFLKSTWWLFLFISECYGTVARVITETDPTDSMNAVQADERWRLAGP